MYSSALTSQFLTHWWFVQLVSQENTSQTCNFSKCSNNLVPLGWEERWALTLRIQIVSF